MASQIAGNLSKLTTTKKTHQSPAYWGFIREYIGIQWIPLTKGQERWKTVQYININ